MDTGMWNLSQLLNYKNPRKIERDKIPEAIEMIVRLYTTKKWKKNLYSIFPNNPITNPSVKNSKERYKNYLELLLDEIPGTLPKYGNCISCGRFDTTDLRSKTEIPLLGSGSLINFFPMGIDGASYCSVCTLAVQFFPLSTYLCGNFLLLHSDQDSILWYWSKKSIDNVRLQFTTQKFSGCIDTEYKNPENALFSIIYDITGNYYEDWYEDSPSINLYYFSNYNQNPDITIYNLPTPVFRFMTFVRTHDEIRPWHRIIKKGFLYINWEEVKSEDDYKNKPNMVYRNLIENKSIVSYFIDHKKQEAIGNWNLFSYYLKEVRKMDDERIKTIKIVGDRISEYIKYTKSDKRLKQLERASKYDTFLNLLRLIEKGRIGYQLEDPIFTLDEFIKHMFPKGALTWKETRNMILFRIYENLHQWLIEQQFIDEDQEEEEEITI